ncbi:hypothetical protein HDF18_08520 [Mucilaginibacter sp. X5P1]|uniref:hypothetical protein n=1 Tax=Mucilaginibacter sp. X5P1 TaxID=2723088 RepID=UPI00161E42B8|nr:hypothetical protein [Mucilaginibacter sp. X5P1]MBB6137701.1 hypothetical protein [Mucilaginibacter sp. X5P1]
MDINPNSSESENFSTLTAIMNRFDQIPFDQFQRELNEWFLKTFKTTNPELAASPEGANLVQNVMSLGDEIFKWAEQMEK